MLVKLAITGTVAVVSLSLLGLISLGIHLKSLKKKQLEDELIGRLDVISETCQAHKGASFNGSFEDLQARNSEIDSWGATAQCSVQAAYAKLINNL